MKNCDNELKIIGLIEEEITGEERLEITSHLEQCRECRKLFNEYAGLKSKTAAFYSSIDFNNRSEALQKYSPRGNFIKRISIAFPVAASFLLGFLLIFNGADQDNNSYLVADSTYKIIEEPFIIVSQSEWNLELNLIQQKIEVLSEQLKQ
jgi:hypothetical protein